MIDIVWLGPVSPIPGVDWLTFGCRLQFTFCGHCLNAAECLDSLSTIFYGSIGSVAWPCLPRAWHFLS